MTVLKQTAELDLLDMLLVYYTIHTGNFFERCSEVVGGGLFSGFATSENGTYGVLLPRWMKRGTRPLPFSTAEEYPERPVAKLSRFLGE